MSDPKLHVLDVGHGNAAVLVDGKSVIVFDAGTKNTLLQFLRDESISQIDSVLISHADKDHIEGLFSLLESGTVQIGRVRLNANLVKKTAIWSDLNYLLAELDLAEIVDFDTSLTIKHSGDFDTANVKVEILAPSQGLAATGVGSKRKDKRMISSNGISVVFRLIVGGIPKVILLGDVSLDGFVELLEHCPNPEAEVMIYPHHGGHSDSDDPVEFARALCDTITPSIVFFSIGRGMHDTPIPEVVSEIRSRLSDVRIGCTQLSEHCSGSVPSNQSDHLTSRFAVGKLRRQCCTGTITIALETKPQSVLPAANEHADFIEIHAPSALCTRDFDSED